VPGGRGVLQMVKVGNGVGGNRAVNSGGIHRPIPLKYLVFEVFKLPPTPAKACGTFAWISPSQLCIVVQQLQRSPRKYFNKTIGCAGNHELRTKGSAIRIRPGAPHCGYKSSGCSASCSRFLFQHYQCGTFAGLRLTRLIGSFD
jgi:hypothetical protein